MLDDIDPWDFHKIRTGVGLYWTMKLMCEQRAVTTPLGAASWTTTLPLLLLFLHYTTHDKLAEKKLLIDFLIFPVWKWRANLKFSWDDGSNLLTVQRDCVLLKKRRIQRGWKVWAQGPVCKSLWRRPVRSNSIQPASSRPQECASPAANVLLVISNISFFIVLWNLNYL